MLIHFLDAKEIILFKLNSIEILKKHYYTNVKRFLNKAFLRTKSHIVVSTPILYLCMCSDSQKLHYFQPRGFHFGRILILRNDWPSPWEEISLLKMKQTNRETNKTPQTTASSLFLCLNLVHMEIKVHKHRLRGAEAFIKNLDEH